MARSGITVPDECVEVFKDMKEKNRKKNMYYAIFKIENEKEIVCSKQVTKDEMDAENPEMDAGDKFKEFVSKNFLPTEACYAIIDYDWFNQKSGSKRDDVIMITWTPEHCPIKQKMLYASTKATLKQKFSGVKVEHNATDLEELDEKCIIEKLGKTG